MTSETTRSPHISNVIRVNKLNEAPRVLPGTASSICQGRSPIPSVVEYTINCPTRIETWSGYDV